MLDENGNATGGVRSPFLDDALRAIRVERHAGWALHARRRRDPAELRHPPRRGIQASTTTWRSSPPTLIGRSRTASSSSPTAPRSWPPPASRRLRHSVLPEVDAWRGRERKQKVVRSERPSGASRGLGSQDYLGRSRVDQQSPRGFARWPGRIRRRELTRILGYIVSSIGGGWLSLSSLDAGTILVRVVVVQKAKLSPAVLGDGFRVPHCIAHCSMGQVLRLADHGYNVGATPGPIRRSGGMRALYDAVGQAAW